MDQRVSDLAGIAAPDNVGLDVIAPLVAVGDLARRELCLGERIRA